jgi:hypothetical protein
MTQTASATAAKSETRTEQREMIMKKTTKKTAETVLVLRTCSADMTSHGGFRWPKRGPVSAPDWIDNYECGNGLHGWLWGEGDGSLGHVNTPKAKWLVVRVLASEIRHGAGHLLGKCKFPRGYVVHCGTRKSATEYIMRHGASGKAVIGSTVTAGHYGTATTGHGGTATAGCNGTAMAGYRGTATVGPGGTATAGPGGTATAGYRGTATAGSSGTATAGSSGTATAGYCGIAATGHGGTAMAGYCGIVTAGPGGTAIAGQGGIATAGDKGTICLQYYDAKSDRYRMAVAYVGEDGILPNRKYKLNGSHEFVEVK